MITVEMFGKVNRMYTRDKMVLDASTSVAASEPAPGASVEYLLLPLAADELDDVGVCREYGAKRLGDSFEVIGGGNLAVSPTPRGLGTSSTL